MCIILHTDAVHVHLDVNIVYFLIGNQDTAALDFAVEQDVASGRIPVMVIAYAGTPLSGHVEDMTAIREICNKYKIWMHVQG